MSLTFPFPLPLPRGACSRSLQISASGETLQLLQMLKCWSHPLSAPDYHHSVAAAHPRWFTVQQAAVSVHWKEPAKAAPRRGLWGPCDEQPITALNPCWCVKPIRSRDSVAWGIWFCMVDVGRLRPRGDREGLCTLLRKGFMRANWPEIALLFSTGKKSALSLYLLTEFFFLSSGTKCHVVTACCYVWGVKGIKQNAFVLRWSSTAEPIFFMSINKERPVKRQTHWKCLEREGPFKKKKKKELRGDWTSLPSNLSEADSHIFFLLPTRLVSEHIKASCCEGSH